MTKKTIKLVFKQKPKNKPPIRLIFGKDDGGEIPVIRHLVDSTIQIDELVVNADIHNNYGINENTVSRYEKTIFTNSTVKIHKMDIGWGLSDDIKNDLPVNILDALKINSSIYVGWLFGDGLKKEEYSIWGNAFTVQTKSDTLSDSTNTLKKDKDSFWGFSVKISTINNGYSSSTLKYEEKTTAKWGISSQIQTGNYKSYSYHGFQKEFKELAKWGFGVYPENGKSNRPLIDFIEWPKKPKPLIVKKSASFCQSLKKSPFKLIFGRKCPPRVKEVDSYVIVNDVSIIRTDTEELIDFVSVNVNIDRQSFAWSGSVTIHASEAFKILDKPEIEIRINQLKWRMDIKPINTDLTFNNSYVTFNCISSAMKLSTIPATEISEDATAQNIAAAQVLNSGLDTGYDVEWNAVDWMIPSGLINFYRRKVIEVISEIVDAAGAIITPHYYEHKLIARNRYDEYYWNELKPKIVIPMDVLTSYGEIEQETESIDSIIVTGENVGITGAIRRFGFDGSRPGEMKVDKLITEERVARARGATEINQTGNKLMIRGEMPLIKDIGYYYPAEIIQIDDKKGYIDAIDVNVMSENGATVVRYGVTIEHHKNDVF